MAWCSWVQCEYGFDFWLLKAAVFCWIGLIQFQKVNKIEIVQKYIIKSLVWTKLLDTCMHTV